MAAFCVNCGAPLSEGAKFCSKCGTTVASSVAGSVSPVPSVPAAPPSNNTAVKVIMAVLAVFLFLSLLAVGSCFYIGYRAKQRLHEFSRQLDADATPYRGKRDPCAMLSTTEASSALGQPVSSVEQRGTMSCEYRFGPTGKSLNIEYTWTGGAIAMRLAHGAMKQISGAESFTTVEGIGDEAYVAPMGSGLMMRKGDVLVNMDLQAGGVSVEAAKKMAAKIADRL
jgi:hypothetical protein